MIYGTFDGKRKNLILRHLIIETSLKIFIGVFDSDVLSPFAVERSS